MYGPITDPEAAQFRFFDAYATFMRIAAGEQPTLVVLDDLHWADKPTLLLLQHVARELGRMRVLIVGTYRDTELARTHPLSEALAELNRGEGLARVSLRGLTAQEVASYIREAANVEPSPALVEQVFEEKEGNPFFLSQVVNLMTEEGTIDSDSVSDIAIPEGVREALGRRLDRLSEEANELLTVAAVVGREFTYDTLTLLQQRDDEARLRLVEEGLEARVIEEGDEPGQYRFTHALMQETLLAELSTTRRVLLHGQIGEAMERRYGGRAEEQAPRLAQHFVESATLTAEHAGRALRYSRVAAEQASAAHARTQAAQHYETCLRLIEGLAATNQGLTGVESEAGEGPWASEEAEVRLALGRALTGGGGVGDSRVHLDRALDLYEAAGDASGFAQTVIAARENPTRYTPSERADLRRAALARLGDGDPYLLARLLIRSGLAGGAEPDGWEESADRDAARAGELAAQHGFGDVEALLLVREAARAITLNRFEESAALSHKAYEAFEALGEVRLASIQLSMTAQAHYIAGHLDGAAEAAQIAHEYASRFGRDTMRLGSLSQLVAIYRMRGEFEHADRLLSLDDSDLWLRLEVAHALTLGDVEAAQRKPGSTEPATRFGCRDTQTGAPLKLG